MRRDTTDPRQSEPLPESWSPRLMRVTAERWASIDEHDPPPTSDCGFGIAPQRISARGPTSRKRGP